jgi:hypothetical protein
MQNSRIKWRPSKVRGTDPREKEKATKREVECRAIVKKSDFVIGCKLWLWVAWS